jgi:transposase
VHALIFTAVVSRHMFVWLTYSQTLAAMIAGCEAAWGFFGGVFKVLIPDNLKAVVTDADAVNPRLFPRHHSRSPGPVSRRGECPISPVDR